METIKDIILSEEQLRSKKSEKWRTYPSDVIPAWLADMDYSVAQEIRDILKETVLQSDLGYSMQPSALGIPNIVAERMLKKYNWILDPHKLEFLNDTVQAIYIAITQFTRENDSVIILSPGYPPIYQCLIQLNRKPIFARFTLVGDVLCLDIERFIECFNENVSSANLLP
jgi:cystathionine beta-lyase